MHKTPTARRRLASAVFATILSLLLVVPASAWEAEGGWKNCGEFIAYVHARFSIDGETAPPGDVFHFWNYSSGWHTVEDNGGYAGWWDAYGYDYLDEANTFTGCRNFG